MCLILQDLFFSTVKDQLEPSWMEGQITGAIVKFTASTLSDFCSRHFLVSFARSFKC